MLEEGAVCAVLLVTTGEVSCYSHGLIFWVQISVCCNSKKYHTSYIKDEPPCLACISLFYFSSWFSSCSFLYDNITNMLFAYCIHVFLLISAVSSSSTFSISGRIKNLRPSKLLKVFNDIKYEAYEVNDLGDISVDKLRKMGIARVISTNSLVISESLADNVLDPYKLSLDGIFRKPKPNLLNDFYQVSYEDMVSTTSYTPWTPIDDCISAKRSNGPVTVTRGWSMSVGSGVTTTLQLASLFGLTPSFSWDYFGSTGVSGSITCSVEKGKMLQFLVRNQFFTLSGVKTRKLNIVDLKGRWGQHISELEYGDDDWEVVEYTIVNTKNIQTSCVTDPNHQTC